MALLADVFLRAVEAVEIPPLYIDRRFGSIQILRLPIPDNPAAEGDDTTANVLYGED